MKNNQAVGAKIQSIRESKQLSIEDVAARSGLSLRQIEDIENNKVFPSLSPLIKIARTLGVRLGTFLDDQEELGPVICRKDDYGSRKGLSFSNNATVSHKHMEYFALSQGKSGRHMEPFMIDIAHAKNADFILSTHEGEEFLYVLEGVVEINYGKHSYILEEGDSIYYDSIVAHHVHAYNGNPARILGIVYTP
jgi:transcriptional regulator with XRE-family HTH domain